MPSQQTLAAGGLATEGEVRTVAYQGIAGAYGEHAAREVAPGAEPRGLPNFRDVFTAVSSGEADLGVVPVENSLAGGVHQNDDLLLEHDLHIVGEVVVRVSHHLLALPGTQLEDVRRVYSHPQALAQSQGFLDAHGMQAIPVYDTAGAAQELSARREPGAAAIASQRAGELYGLETLAAAIEDETFNFTRFLVLSRSEAGRVEGAGGRKTSIVFAVRHRPGALLECLAELKSLNLTRIQSRPRRDRAWSYVFHVDFEGDARDATAAEALAGLLHRAAFVKVLGSYPAAVQPVDD